MEIDAMSRRSRSMSILLKGMDVSLERAVGLTRLAGALRESARVSAPRSRAWSFPPRTRGAGWTAGRSEGRAQMGRAAQIARLGAGARVERASPGGYPGVGAAPTTPRRVGGDEGPNKEHTQLAGASVVELQETIGEPTSLAPSSFGPRSVGRIRSFVNIACSARKGCAAGAPNGAAGAASPAQPPCSGVEHGVLPPRVAPWRAASTTREDPWNQS